MILKVKTRRKKTDRQKMEAMLDDLYREYIRKRAMKLAGGCQRCHQPQLQYLDLQTAHCHGSAKRTTRWDVRNSAGLCGGCHRTIDAYIGEKELLFRRILGDEEYECLYVLANMNSKQSPVDHKLIEIQLRELLKEVQ